jgi:dTDP-4-amino-4,6-dideoxygalactose transaminase
VIRADTTLRVARPSLPDLDELRDALTGTWETAMLSNFGPAARRLEAICREYTGLPDLHAVSSADVGLTLALAALDLPRGAPAVVPSFSFPSTVHAVLWNGLRPVFADVDPATWCLTAESAAPALERAGAGAAAIVGTHAFMATCDVAGLERAASAAGAALVFDAAHAYATWIGGAHAGAFGDASVFSFSATKVVTTGEGGLAAFGDPVAAARFARLRSYGMERDYSVLAPGLNGKLSELHAALGCLTLPRTEELVAERVALADRYGELLAGAPGIALQRIPEGVRPTPTQMVVDVGDRRDAAATELARHGIETRTYFRPLNEMAPFTELDRAPLPVTERLGRSLLTLPLHAGMGVADVDRVCAVLLDVADR